MAAKMHEAVRLHGRRAPEISEGGQWLSPGALHRVFLRTQGGCARAQEPSSGDSRLA